MVLGKLFGRKKVKEVSYEDSKLLAKDGNSKVRAELAANPTARPEVLYFLAEDNNVAVRKKVAGNSNTPYQANNILATDDDQEVRGELARKICRLLPSLSGEEADQIREQTIEVLEILAEDQLPSIRSILSESLKDSLVAPKHVIKSLAQDVEEIVASPVLEFSPLLSESDLLEIIAGGVASGSMASIARRASITEDISDAVAASMDVPAVAALLSNKSARVREETLDQLIDQAEGIEQLHEPLVLRVDLSIRAMRRIAGFVAVSLVDKLVEKNKLSKDVEKELKKQVRDRIGKKNNFDDDEGESGLDRAEAAYKAGRLSEDSISNAVAEKDFEFIQAGLAFMSDIPVATGKSILNSRNGKVVTALCWKSGVSMRLAMKIQQDIAHVPPRDIVNAKDGVAYPFDDKEMDWQLSFFVGE